jgi:hypothetical protein
VVFDGIGNGGKLFTIVVFGNPVPMDSIDELGWYVKRVFVVVALGLPELPELPELPAVELFPPVGERRLLQTMLVGVFVPSAVDVNGP